MATDETGQAIASPTAARSARPTRVGVVTSAVRDKSIKVTVPYQVKHPKYGKYLQRRMTLHAHDEKTEAAKGDLVEIAECRPISKTKHWRLLRIVEKAPQRVAGGGS